MASGGGAGVGGGVDDLLRVLQRPAIASVVGGSNAGRSVREEIEITQGMPCVLKGMPPVTTAGGRNERLRRHGWTRGVKYLVVHRRPGYPLIGCSPAEPTSVSLGEKSITEEREQSKIKPELPVRKTGKSVAKEWPFFVQRMGSTSN